MAVYDGRCLHDAKEADGRDVRTQETGCYIIIRYGGEVAKVDWARNDMERQYRPYFTVVNISRNKV